MPPIKKKDKRRRKGAGMAKRAPRQEPKPKKTAVPKKWSKLVRHAGYSDYLTLSDGTRLDHAVNACSFWDIRVGGYVFTDCEVSCHIRQNHDRDGTSTMVATARVPDGPTLLLTGGESIYPNRKAHELREKEERIAALKARLDDIKRRAGRNDKTAARLKAELAELEGA